MHPHLTQRQSLSLLDDAKTYQKLEFNHRKNKEQDNTEKLDEAAKQFSYDACKDEFWNPEKFSLLYGTPLWDQSTESQKVLLNQLYWVAYYSQIISAEIATIYLNQAAAAGFYSFEDFRIVCDNLDLESGQERAHINAFKKISEEMEYSVFGERVFTYPMRPYYVETMIFQNTNRVKEFYRRLQVQAYSLLSTGNAFLGCQYFTVRGLRTLKGKMIQHQLAQYYMRHKDKENAPIPSKISFYHFLDESFHFNSSVIISQDVVHSLNKPTAFEAFVTNRLIEGCQKDHFYFSSAINGIFWYDPALYKAIYKVLRSKAFGMNDADARQMLEKCFTQENEGMHEAFQSHKKAQESYKTYVEKMAFVNSKNKAMSLMAKNSLEYQLSVNREGLRRFSV
jgi:hypothetical protein